MADVGAGPGMSTADLRDPTPAATSRSRALLVALIAYALLLALATRSGHDGLAALAVVVLVGGALVPALRGGHRAAWLTWVICVVLGIAAAWRGAGWLLADAVPILVNAGLCVVFARSLRRGSMPLIARFIATLEGAQRLAEPRVVGYARGLTWCWALVLGAQALLLGLIVLLMPAGVLALAGGSAPLGAPAWRTYLHVGSYLVVGALLVGEYGYRRWYLRGIDHATLPAFLAALARHWPALLRGALDDAPRRPQ